MELLQSFGAIIAIIIGGLLGYDYYEEYTTEKEFKAALKAEALKAKKQYKKQYTQKVYKPQKKVKSTTRAKNKA